MNFSNTLMGITTTEKRAFDIVHDFIKDKRALVHNHSYGKEIVVQDEGHDPEAYISIIDCDVDSKLNYEI